MQWAVRIVTTATVPGDEERKSQTTLKSSPGTAAIGSFQNLCKKKMVICFFTLKNNVQTSRHIKMDLHHASL